MSNPYYPDGPNAAGVPAVQRDPAASSDGSADGNLDVTFPTTLASSDGAGLPADAPVEQWGIYTSSGQLAR